MKKPTITTAQQASFRERARLSFIPPYDWASLKEELEKAPSWKKNKWIQKLLFKTIAPLALELLDETTLRLVGDRFFTPTPSQPLEALFGFSLLKVAVLCGEELLFLHPNMPVEIQEPVYVAMFAGKESRYLHRPSDPENGSLKKDGYGFGDLLPNETHPLFFRS